MTDEGKSPQERTTHTEGGAYVEGTVNTGGGNFAGRDVVYGDKVVSRSAAEELSDYLAKAVSAFETRSYQVLTPSAVPPDQPYKFLYAFETEDTDIFFGRDAASQGLYDTVLKDRLTVLHAKSGAGKTSLLNAGLSPRLIRERRLPFYARAYDDPVRAIKRAIAPPSLGQWPELLSKLTLHEFLGLACQHLNRQTQELVVILDQFEEFFVFWPEREHRKPFIDALADCYEDRALPIHFVISIRDDYFGRLATFQDRLPHIFHNEFYLDSMTREEAETAVIGPVSRLGRPVTYEQSLLNTLLDDLMQGGIELPHLQIICTRLYEALAEGETDISLATYEAMKHAEGILGSYLNDALTRLPGRGADIAKNVLKELVSSESTRRVLSYERLAERIGGQGLDTVLAKLVDARLLHRDESAGEVTYEMAHEYLIHEIGKWIDREDLVFKQAEELLSRELANWRVHGTLIPRDRLELLYAHREQFAGLGDEAWECILMSAVEVEFAIEDWLKSANGAAPATVAGLLEGANENVWFDVLRYLSTRGQDSFGGASAYIWNERIVQSLFRIAGDADQELAMLAAQTLAEVGEAVHPLVMEALQGEDRQLWRAALRYLREQPDDPLCAEIPGRVWEELLGQPLMWVPAGPFRMGSEKSQDSDAHENELPQHQVTLPGYWIGKHPVTVVQFQAFVEERGHSLRNERGLQRPDDHPMTYVDWNDAMAYCRWLTEKTGIPVTLPSEAEWEKAARGTDGRIYPWGNEWDATKCNTRESDIGDTTPVDRYPQGASAYGCLDMVGNVWEWTRSLWVNYPYDPDDDGREDLDAPDNVRRVLRGGSWGIDRYSARCARRFRDFPDNRFRGSGFRVCCSPIS